MSGATLTPEDAVRFARGEEVVSNTGQPVKLSRPLDWIAVTDHSDGMGVISELKAGNPELMADALLKRWHDMMRAGPEQAAAATMELRVGEFVLRVVPIAEIERQDPWLHRLMTRWRQRAPAPPPVTGGMNGP